MTAPVIWLVAGMALLVAEVLIPGVFMMWLGIAALGTGALLQWQDMAFAWQVLAFALLAAIALGIGVRIRPARRQASLNTQEAGLRLDDAKAATGELSDGSRAIVPGSAATSGSRNPGGTCRTRAQPQCN